jgi:replication factor C subunit 2/4
MSEADAATGIAIKSGQMSIPWVEKYRPQTMADVVGNADTVARLRVIAREGNLPNLMLAGPPGTGKTTSMLCLARELLGDQCKDAVLELNASDDRGLDVVRNKIKLFAQRKVSLPGANYHKIVILDEADSMTPQAQQALRRTMELHSATTRFAFACNNSSKIIEPIQSRCAVVRFTRLTGEEVLRRVAHVADMEKVNVTPDGYEAIQYISDGDMRNALNCLQATHAGFGVVNADNVFKVCDQPHPIVIEEIYKQCLNAKDLNGAHKELNRLMGRGYAAADVMSTFFKVAQNPVLFRDEENQLACLKIVGEANLRVAEGCGSQLQLAAMLARIVMQCSGRPTAA